jgi:hypothetical protein
MQVLHLFALIAVVGWSFVLSEQPQFERVLSDCQLFSRGGHGKNRVL